MCVGAHVASAQVRTGGSLLDDSGVPSASFECVKCHAICAQKRTQYKSVSTRTLYSEQRTDTAAAGADARILRR